MIHLWFVCMGNICRSPTAHAVMQRAVEARGWTPWVTVHSAGTHAYHVGEPPDPRSVKHGATRGLDLTALRAQQLRPEDIEQAHLVLVMDWDNLALVQDMAPARHHPKIKRLTEFCSRFEATVVPDPYLGGAAGFEEVLDLVEDACEGLCRHLERLKPAPGRPGD